MLHVFGAERWLGIRSSRAHSAGRPVDLMSLQLLLPHASVNSKCQWMLKNISNWQRGPGANAYTLKPFKPHHTRSLCTHHMFKVLLQISPRYWCRLVQHTGPVHCALFSRALASKYEIHFCFQWQRSITFTWKFWHTPATSCLALSAEVSSALRRSPHCNAGRTSALLKNAFLQFLHAVEPLGLVARQLPGCARTERAAGAPRRRSGAADARQRSLWEVPSELPQRRQLAVLTPHHFTPVHEHNSNDHSQTRFLWLKSRWSQSLEWNWKCQN